MAPLPLSPSLEEFRTLATQGNLIPVWTDILADAETPVSAFQKLDNGGTCFLLESAEKSDKAGRYSFVGTRPRILLESRGHTIRITEDSETREFQTTTDPLAELQALMAKYKWVKPPKLEDAAGPTFTGGAVGFLSYNAVRFFEPSIGAPQPDPLDIPDAIFFLSDSVLIFDHLTKRLRVLINAHIPSPDQADSVYAAAGDQVREIFALLAKATALPQLPIPTSPIAPAEAG